MLDYDLTAIMTWNQKSRLGLSQDG